MGCTNCGGKVGCDHRKGAMMDTVDRVLAELYPTKTWEPGPAGASPRGIAALADAIADELTAATFVEPAQPDATCDFVWILCLGRAPCAIQVRDHGLAAPAEWTGASIRELYLRVCVARRAPLAGVQQIAARVDDGVLELAPRAGVYDAPLLPRMQQLVAVLAASDLLHVDFGEIAHAPPGYAAGAWRDLYGGDPAIANYLFYPQPTTMISTELLAGRAS